MTFEDDAFYSLKPDDSRKSKNYLSVFYNKMSEPNSILLLLGWAFTWTWTKVIPIIRQKYESNDPQALFTLVLFITTTSVWIRILQSLYWAKKDYSKLEYGISDIAIFGAVTFFTSGVVFAWFSDHPLLISATYTILCSLAVWNFINLGKDRLPAEEKYFDVSIEKRIQAINAVIFSALLIEFAIATALLLLNNGTSDTLSCLAIVPVIPLMVLNMAHSHQLSNWPKLLVNNKHLEPKKIEERISAIVGFDDDIFRKKRNVINAFKEYSNIFKAVSIRRAAERDIGFIRDLYIEHFEYVLEALVSNSGLDNRKLMQWLLRNGFGLGALGYLRFYIIEIDGKAAGFIMPEFRTDPGLYSAVGRISLFWFLWRRMGLRGVRRVTSHVRDLRALEARPGLKELRINYIAALNPRQGTGSRVLRLLRQAFLESSVNGFEAHMITAYVRDKNEASIELFRKAGFTEEHVDQEARDPLRTVKGTLIKFTLAL